MSYYDDDSRTNKSIFSLGATISSLLFIGVLVLSLIATSFEIINTGERGVILRLGKYSGIMDEGLNFKTPFIDTVIDMNVRDVTHNAKLEVSSKDMQTILVDMSLIYALDPENVGKVYQKYGMRYEDVVVKPTLAEITNSVIANYPIEQFVEKRKEISDQIFNAFAMKTQGTGVVIKSLLLTNHDFSDEYNRAVEQKKVAEQGALKAKFDLERVTLEAKAQMEKQKSLNPMVLQEKAIDKWDGKLPQYYSGDSLPFIMKQ